MQAYARKGKKRRQDHNQSQGLKVSSLPFQAIMGREEVGKPQALPTSAVKSVPNVKIKSWSAHVVRALCIGGDLEAQRGLNILLKSHSKSGQNWASSQA